MWLILLHTKAEAPTAIMTFQARVECETGKKLKVLHTDIGGEFTSVEFGEHCVGEGIQRHLSAPYSPQQNGIVEHRNQMIVGTARSILRARGMLGHFWGEAVHTVVFLLNRSPTNTLNGMTPYQAWYGKKPPVHFLRVFRCVAYIKHLRPHLSKLDDRGQKVVFIGYQDGSKAYRFYDPSSERVHVSCDAVFDEGTCWEWGDSVTRSGLESFTVEWEYQLRLERSETQPAISSSPAAASPRTLEVQPATPPSATPSAPMGA
jgi:hypothetical protein